ncbi:MAG: hypothetical protein ACRC9Q_07185 [Bacteroidales bacterium]
MKAMKFLVAFLVCVFFTSGRPVYKGGPLVLTESSLTDALGGFNSTDLPSVQPLCNIPLTSDASEIGMKMWQIALNDAERNIVENQHGRYFSAGTRYTDRIYNRDISFAGLLGLNSIYPELMLQSLKITRDVRARIGYKVSSPHVIPEINAPWEVITDNEKEVMSKYKTNSYTRRTDDVVWIWATDHLFESHPDLADWEWFYQTAKYNFEFLYDPWFDSSDGLYRAQPTFQDLTSSAYPNGMSIADCVLLKGTSTNCIYYRAMLTMEKVAKKLNLPKEAKQWKERAKNLKAAIRKELILPDGTLTYYKDRYGVTLKHQHNLGTAFAIIFKIVEGKEALKALSDYPTSDVGIPLIHPFLPDNKGAHNMASWPFCSTFFLYAKEIAEKKDYTGYNAALLARTLGTKFASDKNSDWGTFGTFHEKVVLPSGLIDGSGQQLWTSASFINVCLRANLVKGVKFTEL